MSDSKRLLTSAIIAGLAIVLVAALPIHAQQEMQDVQINTIPVSDGVYMLMGRGGNMGLSIGDDGAFLIDDQYAPLTEKIKAAIAAVTDKPVRFVVNTHWHGDHTGGNENLGEAGAIIVAHENVRKRMSVEQFSAAFNRTTPASPEGALPVITFADAVTFHWNGETLHVFHVNASHTDGDAIIHFEKANAVHMGDTFFNGFYPYIDVSAGGSMDGMIATANKLLAMVDDNTKIIPGHGQLSNKSELRDYRNMLEKARDRIAKLIDEGKSQEEVVAAKPTSELDEKWGGGFMRPDVWVGIVYDSMKE
jgi:glyoxylase-like metal-dependent hydrolase (beta-lactamase superfamily II)